MKFFIKRNKVNIIIFILCLLIMLYFMTSSTNIEYILKQYVSSEEYRKSIWTNDGIGFIEFVPEAERSIFRLIWVILTKTPYQFDVSIIFGTALFSIFLPLFPMICTYDFYRYYHSIYKSAAYRGKGYRADLNHTMHHNALKMAGTLFLSYFIYMCIVKAAASEPNGAPYRSLLHEIFNDRFYGEHTFIYFFIEGLIRFFWMPYIYCRMGEAAVLYESDWKKPVFLPALYYYGLTAAGMALANVIPVLSIYISPAVLMANGDFEFNSFILLAVNALPMILAWLMTYYRTRYVEI